MKLVGANPKPKVEALDELPGKSNYFIGNDPKKWRTNVPSYARVKYENVYPGIDLVYYGNQRQLEYDFVLTPGADPNAIVLEIDGAVAATGTPPLQIDSNGELIISTDGGEVRFHKPVVYQPAATSDAFDPKSKITNPKSIEGHYVLLADNRIGFKLGAYDRSQPLVIDPTLSYSTYLGGSDLDYPNGIAVDSDGNAYVVGGTSSVDFPTAGPPGASSEGLSDVFVTKLNADGSGLVCSGYLGGGGNDYGHAIAVDAAGNVYVTGNTNSSSFPVTSGVVKDTLTGSNAFVTKLNASCSGLDYSTYLGGSEGGRDPFAYDGGQSIAVDSSGNAYVSGWTFSWDFPTTAGAYDTTCGTDGQCNPSDDPRGEQDLFVAKLDPAATSLLYSTYLGGSGWDGQSRHSLGVDSLGSIYVTGSTVSADFPTTPTAFDATCGTDGACNPTNGSFFYDTFLAKIDPAQAGAASLVYSTFVGGSWWDQSTGIAVDPSGNVYLAGGTNSADLPTTADAYQPIHAGGTCGTEPNTFPCADAFVMKFDPTQDGAASLVYSTYLGGSGGDGANAIALNAAGSTYVAGYSASEDFPLVSPTQATYGGGTCTNRWGTSYPCIDAFVAKLNASGSELIFSTYLGGNKDDRAWDVAVDSSGNAYVMGIPGRTGFPTTSGAFRMASTDTCADFQTAYVPFVQMYGPQWDSNGNCVILGQMTTESYSTLQTLPLPTVLNQKYCTPVVAAPDFSVPLYVPTAAERAGDFSWFAGQIDDPITGDPLPGNVIPAGRIPDLMGWRRSPNYAGGDAFVAKLTGLMLPVAQVVPETDLLDLGSIGVGFTSSPQTLTVTNVGDGALTLTSVVVTGDFAETNTCGSSLDPGASCTFSVTLTPTAVGTRAGQIMFTTNLPTSPDSLDLTGNGLAAPAINLPANSLDFGALRMGTDSTETVTLSNPGTAALNIASIALSSGTGDFDLSHDCPASVAIAGSCTLTVTFTPTVLGGQAETITITHDAPHSPHTITLSGTGTDVSIAVKSGSSDTATVNAGQTASYTLTLDPKGLSGNTTITCTGAPQASTCTANPSTVTLDGATPADIAISVRTTARSLTTPLTREPPLGPSPPIHWFGWLLALLLLASLISVTAASDRRARTSGLLLSATLLMALMWTACGGGGAEPAPPPTTPAGTYTLTVTATAGDLSTSTELTLRVN